MEEVPRLYFAEIVGSRCRYVIWHEMYHRGSAVSIISGISREHLSGYLAGAYIASKGGQQICIGNGIPQEFQEDLVHHKGLKGCKLRPLSGPRLQSVVRATELEGWLEIRPHQT